MSFATSAVSQPIYHRADITYIASALRSGNSCTIVGVSNIGKSSLLRSLRRPDVQRALFGAQRDAYLVIYVDFNLMWEMSDQGFYEVILRAISSQADTLTDDTETINRIRRAYQELINPTSPFLIPVSFNEGLMALNEKWERRLVLLLDEFDEPWASLDRRAFLNLRALRDRYQEQLCYVTATLRPLSEIRPGREVGEFCELFMPHTRYVAPLPADEARAFIQSQAARQGTSFDEDDIAFIMRNADGHPALLEHTCMLLQEAKALAGTQDEDGIDYARVEEALDGDARVRTECAKLWADLNEREQEALLTLLTNRAAPEDEAFAGLRRKHLVVQRGGESSPFCGFFRRFVWRQHLVRHREERGVRVDVDSGTAYVDGRAIAPLTDLEYRLLLLLYGNLDKICDKYKVVEAVWGESYIDQVDDARIEKLVSRLRQKIETDSSNPRYVITVRGRGYKLASPQ